MKKTISLITILLFCQVSFAQFTKAPRDKKIPCPPPKFKKGQTPAQVREDTRIYVECVAQANQKREAEKQARRDANRVADNPSRSSNPRNASNGNGGRQRQDANKERNQQRYEQRQRENQQRREEAERKKRERDGN